MIWDDGDYYAMHFGLTGHEIFWAAWAEVWREMRLALPLPRKLTPHGRHGSRALGQPAPTPTIRSWLGSEVRPPHHLI